MCTYNCTGYSSPEKRAQRAVKLNMCKYAPLDDHVQELAEVMADLDQWERPMLHAGGEDTQQMKHDISQRADKARLDAKKEKFKHIIVDHGEKHFNELVKAGTVLAAKDWIWWNKYKIEEAAITKYKKSVAFKAELQKAKMEQKKIEDAKKKIVKLGSLATKIRTELKKLPEPQKLQMVEKHGFCVQKAILDSAAGPSEVVAAEQELRPKWVGEPRKVL
jgi:hypothetical protein